jgi:hypothetical protein
MRARGRACERREEVREGRRPGGRREGFSKD